MQHNYLCSYDWRKSKNGLRKTALVDVKKSKDNNSFLYNSKACTLALVVTCIHLRREGGTEGFFFLMNLINVLRKIENILKSEKLKYTIFQFLTVCLPPPPPQFSMGIHPLMFSQSPCSGALLP